MIVPTLCCYFKECMYVYSENPLIGIMERFFDVGLLEDIAIACGVYNLPARLDWFYLPYGPQIQQSAYNQIHVLPDIAHLSNDTPECSGHHTHLSGATPELGSLLV